MSNMYRFAGSKLQAKGELDIFVVHILKAVNGGEEDGEKYWFHLQFAETSRQYGVSGMPKIIVATSTLGTLLTCS